MIVFWTQLQVEKNFISHLILGFLQETFVALSSFCKPYCAAF